MAKKEVDFDKPKGKNVIIQCEGAALLDLDDLTELQGNLKTMGPEDARKLDDSIVKLGFSFPVAVWKNAGKNYILDATQRTRRLRNLRDEQGYNVPKLPVVWVKAKDKAEAVRKLLAAASQYGEVTPEGLHEFIKVFKMDFQLVKRDFKFPEIKLEKFEAAFYPQTSEVTFQAKTGSTELSEGDFEKFKHTCPKCNYGFN